MQLAKITPLLLLIILSTFLGFSDTLEGKIIKITDGDTVHILLADNKKEKVRLAGIDAPERKQHFGNKSKKHLASMIATQTVRVEFTKRDRYGRIVGKIIFREKDINLEMIKMGFAWHYKKYQNEQSQDDQIQYSVSERNAKKQKYGLWRTKNQIAPWDWRKNKKNLKPRKITTVKTKNLRALNSADQVIKVWVNLKSGKYHCPETRYYQNTKLGRIFKQKVALKKGYKPAHGINCNIK